MVQKLKFSKSLILLYFATVMVFPNMAYSQSDAGCAPDTWTAMANRAAMETRREDVMNKRYIVKADSVLQYSCFPGELVRVVNQTSRIFSNGEQWVDRPVRLTHGFETVMNVYDPSPTILHEGVPNGYKVVPGSGTDYKETYVLGDSTLSYNSMDFHVTNVIGGMNGGPLFNYIDANFGHHVLSDTTDLKYHNICYNMANVWKAAKCKNFDGVATFYSFEELKGVPNFLTSPDPREFPINMPCGVP